MQQIIEFLVTLYRYIISLMLNNELLYWGIVLIVLSGIVSVFSVLFRSHK